MGQELMLIHESLRDGNFPRDSGDAGVTESAPRGAAPLLRNVTLGFCWIPGRADESREGGME